MNQVSSIISGIVGALIGASVSWFITSKHWKNKTDAELGAFKEYYENKINSLTPPIDSKADHIKEVKPEVVSYHSIIKDNYNLEAMTKGTDEDEDIDDAEELIAERSVENTPKDRPYLIHMDAFNGDDEVHYQESYSHISLDYFSGDDKVTLMDTNELVENPDKILGYGWKLHFGDEEYGCDENVVYIRNDQMQADYEVVRDKGYYCQIILGIDPPDSNDEE